MRRPVSLSAFFFLFLSAQAFAFNLSGFDTPESAQVDPETGAYYISNINGGLTDKDGNGYISKVAANGNTVIQRFIGGKPENPVLNAPKGLVIVGKEIFVADIDVIKSFDKETGKLISTIDLSPWGVKFLNDLTIDPSGALYVSDMMTDRIFKVTPQKNYEVKVFAEGSLLNGPNGLVVNPRSRNLMVVTWNGGCILEVDPSGRIHVLKRGLKQLDGIDYDTQGNIYVSSQEKGEVYRVPLYGRGPLTTFLSGLVTPADLSCDRVKGELLVPSFTGNTLHTYPLAQNPAPAPAVSTRPKSLDQALTRNEKPAVS